MVVADMLIRIKNSYFAGSSEALVPLSKINERIAKLLVKEGYLEAEKIKDKELVLKLKKGAITGIKIVSRPSLRVYVKKNQLPRVLGGLGIAVISTPAGLLTDKDARVKGLGGEVIFEIW